MPSEPLVVATTVGDIAVYRLTTQSDIAFIQWGRHLDQDFSRMEQESGDDDERTYCLLHDFRAINASIFSSASHLRAGLRLHGNRGFTIRCAVVVRDESTARILKRLLALPTHKEVETLQINSESHIWADESQVGYFTDFEAAMVWLQSADSDIAAAT